ncbi:NAD(P)H-binding protein [Catenulispora sp. NF23]|uniref:NAD(P)H-binding protein n=1 Tax=Catenulispora pinistramenti TaxID=2705254 RepID=UPI001BA975FC|nr:NAD(P)H-binding protein [Catenulispora pinistramenti]MBS2535099.1 NAD(P)H-binding protein [Catenulispora pinistramenti]
MTVLVTGARGNIGSRVVTGLHAAGRQVRATARDLATLSVPEGVQTARLDLTEDDVAADNPTAFAEALKDVDTVFLYATRTTAAPFLKAAHAAGVRHIVFLSSPASYEAAEFRGPIGRIHRAAEQDLAASGLDHTILYPSWLATNARRDWGAAIRARKPVELPYPAAQCVPIHPDDVAEVAVDLLLPDNATHRGRMQVLTGPASMRLDEAVAAIGAGLGRPTPVREISREAALARREPWMAAEILESLLDSAAAAVGRPAPITNTVERITGHPARPLSTWVAENRTDF